MCILRTKSSICARSSGDACTMRSMPSSTSSSSESVTSTAISTIVCRAVSSPVISRSIHTRRSDISGRGMRHPSDSPEISDGRSTASTGGRRRLPIPTAAASGRLPPNLRSCRRSCGDPHRSRRRRATSGASWPSTASTTSRISAPGRSPTRSGSGTRSCASPASSGARRTPQVLDTSRGIEWATWFTNGKLNVAHELRRQVGRP